MRILAVETATQLVGCALWADGRPLASFSVVAGRRHCETLMPAIDELCRRAGLRPADIEGVAVDIGPGLFTGLRVGLATARSLTLALRVPAVGVTSLEALAFPHRCRPVTLVPVVDARRSEVFWALYSPGGGEGLIEVHPPAVAGPDQLAGALASLDGEVLVVGDGAWRYREVFEHQGLHVGGPSDIWPSPLVIAEIAAGRLANTQPAGPNTQPAGPNTQPAGPNTQPAGPSLPEPLYLRQADVRIGWEQMSPTVPSRSPQ
jgi:tRNA threonylcarbamoyladenosine biosynthesis protein TsaB